MHQTILESYHSAMTFTFELEARFTVSETFYFLIFLCIHLYSPLRSVSTHHSQSAHCQLIMFSHLFALHSMFTHRSVRVYYIEADNNRYMQFTCYFFLINDETQCKDYNSQGSPNKSFILLSHTVTLHFSLVFALCVHSSFTVHKRSPNSVKRELTVCSAYIQCSRGKEKRLRDCNQGHC